MTRLALQGRISAPGGRVRIWFEDDGSAVIRGHGAWVEDDGPAAEEFVEAYQSEWRSESELVNELEP